MRLSDIIVAIIVCAFVGAGGWFGGKLIGRWEGEAACAARVKAAVDKQKAEDEKQIIALTGRLVVIQQEKADGDKEVEDYARRLAAAQPNESGCVLTQGDANEINR